MKLVDRAEEVLGDKPLSITSAVGAGFPPRCLNRPDDVRKIETALNRFSPALLTPDPVIPDATIPTQDIPPPEGG